MPVSQNHLCHTFCGRYRNVCGIDTLRLFGHILGKNTHCVSLFDRTNGAIQYVLLAYLLQFNLRHDGLGPPQEQGIGYFFPDHKLTEPDL